MRRRSVLAVGTVALAGCSDVLDAPDPGEAETLIREGINEKRASADVEALTADDGLATAARDHSENMAERDFYAHEDPSGNGPSDRAGCVAGENIHRGEIGDMQNVDSSETWYTGDVEELAGYVLEGWTLSDGHYELMTNARWARVGVGVVIVDGEFFVTALFC